jgi:hypothetical protein
LGYIFSSLLGFIWAYVADIWPYVGDVFSTPERATAVFTAVLAVATIALWRSTRRLWRVTRIAAEHIPHVERAYVSGGANGVVNLPEHFAVTVDNYGKNPAFIGTFGQTLSQRTNCRIPPFTIRRNLAGSAVKC